MFGHITIHLLFPYINQNWHLKKWVPSLFRNMFFLQNTYSSDIKHQSQVVVSFNRRYRMDHCPWTVLFRLTNQLLLLRSVAWKLNSSYFVTCGMLASDLNSYSPTRSKSKFILASLASAIWFILASQIFRSPWRVGECLCCTLLRCLP